MTTLDPVTLSVLNGRLVQIADEMDATLYRSAFNPIIAEAHDACHGLYHAETGATLVQGTSGLPIFVGAMAFAVKAVIDKVARDGGLDPGDAYEIDRDLVIGRSADCTIPITDTYASGRHLRIAKRGASAYLEDLDSTNGTFLNGDRLTGEVELRGEDVIRIGDTEFRIDESG